MKIGPYEVLRKLGEGAYGKVYLARKGASSGFVTWYALKRISRGNGRGAEFEAYLQREAQVGGLVNHPNLVRVHEVLTLPREWVLVQDYVDGIALSAVLAERKELNDPVPREAALELVAELLETLHYLHTLRDPEGRETGFVHRDVKPGNVMITAGHGIRVMDFGVARGDEAGVGTLAGELRGTLAFMAPEQATGGEVGPASDQFAAGLILLQMLTNASPWGDVRGAAVLGRVVTGDVSHGLKLLAHDVELLPVVQRLLDRAPSLRFGSAAEAADALRALRAKTATPPALRPFCIEAVDALRVKGFEEVDDEPSWTGSFRWTSAAPGMPSSVEVDSLGPAEFSLVGMDFAPPVASLSRDESLSEPIMGGEGATTDANELVVSEKASAAVTDPVPGVSDEGELLELDQDLGGTAGGGAALVEAVDAHDTLPLQTTSAQRAALMATLSGLSGARSETDAIRVGTGETLEEAQARLGDLDPMKTLPLDDGAARLSGSGASASAYTEGVGGRPTSPSLPAVDGLPDTLRRKRRRARKGGATRGGSHPGPRAGSQSVLLVLCALILIAGTARLARMAIVSTRQAEADPDLGDEDLMLPSERLAAKQRGLAPAQPPPEIVPDEVPGGAVPAISEAEPSQSPEGHAEDPSDGVAGATGGGEPSAVDPDGGDHRFEVGASHAVPAEGERQPAITAGDDLDADLASWGGDADESTPAPRRLREGQIVLGSGAGDRLLREADGKRAIATRRDDGTPRKEPTKAAAPTGPRLRLLSGVEQPASVPLSVRVRSTGFYATSVSAYYQWRSEGSAARKRRSLRQQPDGSFVLEIPVSELHSDRLQLWFTAEPGSVTLGDAGSPLEVKVR